MSDFLKNTLMVCISVLNLACASVEKQVSDIDELIDSGWELEYYNEWFDAVLDTFGSNRVSYGPTHDRFTLLIHPTFDEITLIRIEKRPDYKVESAIGIGNFEGFTQVAVSFYDTEFASGSEEHPLQYQRAIRDKFAIELSVEEFDAIFHALDSAELAAMPASSQENGCTDGTRMFAEISKGDERKLVTRHNCDETYKADFSTFEPLFVFAGNKIPSLRSKLAAIWKTETRRELIVK
ncbi:hypothetical protein [Hyphococcus sp.]|uniref:hypothetical protein n=1 Tax=Hyphococcus sp. TaxID=2038636 RepID=UPI003CCB85C6